MPEPESREQLLPVDALQFRRAEPLVTAESSAAKNCAACKQAIDGEYYQLQNHVICAACAAKIEAGRQAPKQVPLLRAVIYGAGAALAGCLLYGAVEAMGVQIGIVALAVGWMVGKAIRHGSYGIGGRRQQILAVGLTYFAISTSFLPAGIFLAVKQEMSAANHPANGDLGQLVHAPFLKEALPSLLVFAVISPFFELASSPASGLISLFILFVGLRYAWVQTARHEIMVSGPYT